MIVGFFAKNKRKDPKFEFIISGKYIIIGRPAGNDNI